MDVVSWIEKHAPEGAEIDREYVRKLIGMPSSMLESEQKTLKFQRDSLVDRSRSLGAEHVDAFLKGSENVDRLEILARRLDQSAKEAVEGTLSIPHAPERSFKAVQSLVERDVVVYENVHNVQKLLALPGHVKDFISAGEYAEALEHASVSRRLRLRYPKSALVAKVEREVSESVSLLRQILLKNLREASKLSLLTKAVTYLREIGLESSLESVFIESRWHFLEREQWGRIPHQLKLTQPFAYLKRVVDIYREHVFGTINGFRVIFKHKSDVEDDHKVSTEAPLARFSRKALCYLLKELREHAKLIENQSERSSLWLQLAFCARSMGRVGADFWRLLSSDIITEEEWHTALQNQQDTARRASKYT